MKILIKVLDDSFVREAYQTAAKNSVLGYIAAFEKEIIARELRGDSESLSNTTITNPDLIDVRGENPDSLQINVSNGSVVGGRIVYNGYAFRIYANGDVVLEN